MAVSQPPWADRILDIVSVFQVALSPPDEDEPINLRFLATFFFCIVNQIVSPASGQPIFSHPRLAGFLPPFFSLNGVTGTPSHALQDCHFPDT